MDNAVMFMLVSLLLVISPGPNWFLILKTVTRYGKSHSFANIAGLTTATFVHGTLSIVGLSAILLGSEVLFFVIKVLGAMYLSYLGVKAIVTSFRKQATPILVCDAEPKTDKVRNLIDSYVEGFLTQILNPKVSLFYLSAFPQFLKIGESSMVEAFSLVAIHASIILLWFVAVTLSVDFVASPNENSKFGLIIQRASGAFMVYFGFMLLTMNPCCPIGVQ